MKTCFPYTHIQLLDDIAEIDGSSNVKTIRIFKVSHNNESFAVKAAVCKVCSAQNKSFFDMSVDKSRVGCSVCGDSVCSASLQKENACLDKINASCVVKKISNEYINKLFPLHSICMEYIPTDLFKIATDGIIIDDVNISKQILLAVHEIHSQGFAHRDIKLENFLYDERTSVVKLCDFGFAYDYSTINPNIFDKTYEILKEKVGSYYYCAPEVQCSDAYNGFLSDVWSLGVTIYALIYKTFPYIRYEENGVIRWKISFIDDNSKNPLFLKVVQNCMNVNPILRKSIKETLHEYFDSKKRNR